MSTYRYRDRELEVDAHRDGDRVTVALADGEPRTFELHRVGAAEFALRDPDSDAPVLHTVHAVRDGNSWWINVDGRTYHLERIVSRAGGAAKGSLIAPTPATVQDVHVADGEQVEEGQVLLVLTAMKMQIEIKAPHAGTVKGLSLAEGDKVDGGVQLAEVVPADDD